MPMKIRQGIAMIELIFALVIMGIVMMSAPMLIATATKSSYVALQQEAINEAASYANMIMGYHWDEADTNEDYDDPILLVSAQGDTNLSTFKFSAWRIGTPVESSRSLIREDGEANISATSPANLGLDGTETKGNEDDIDDFKGASYGLVLVGTTTKNDYAEKAGDINITSDVSYMNDSPGNGDYETTGGDHKITFNSLATTTLGSTNIKKITVTLTDTSGVDELDKTIVLNAFVCNIGANKPFKKAF